jgi:hypothetical protein
LYKRFLLGLLAAAVWIAGTACTHQKPDFTGIWVPVGDINITGAAVNPGLVTQYTIKQTTTILTSFVTVTSKSNPSKKTNMTPVDFDLDGSERRRGRDSISKAYWNGEKLVFETTQSKDGKVVSVLTITWTLMANGMISIDHVLADSGKPEAKYRSYLAKSH